MGRYERLFTLPANGYTEGAPLLITAGALLKDTATGKLLAQLKFTNICDKTVKAVKVRITPYDTVGRPLGEAVPFTYLDLYAARDTNFGQKTPILLTESEARSFTVTVEEVAFADNSLWAPLAGAVWDPLPAPQTVEAILHGQELVKQFALKYGQNRTVWPLRVKDLWFCSCGALNRTEESACHQCIWTQENLDIDIEALNAEAAERVKQEQLAAERADEEARLAAEQAAREAAEARQKAAKRNKRIAAAVCGTAAAGALAWGFVRFAWPLIKTELAYREAQDALQADEFEQARTGFEALADYKESSAMLQETIYQQAEALLAAGDYEAAKINYAELGDYEDAAEKGKEADYRLAGARMEAGDYEAAQKLYKGIGDYKDAKELLEEAGYQAALQAVKESKYAAAVKFFEWHKEYKDCAQQLSDAAYAYGCQLLGGGRFSDAIQQFNKCPDKEEAGPKRLEAEYRYVNTHKEYDDTRTYTYAKELVGQGYPGAQKLYDEIFKLRVKIVISDSDAFPPSPDSYISRYKTVYCYFQLQGEPGKKARVYIVCKWPGIKASRTDDTEDLTVGDWKYYTSRLENPAYGEAGTVTIKIYDSATGSLLGEDSVQII